MIQFNDLSQMYGPAGMVKGYFQNQEQYNLAQQFNQQKLAKEAWELQSKQEDAPLDRSIKEAQLASEQARPAHLRAQTDQSIESTEYERQARPYKIDKLRGETEAQRVTELKSVGDLFGIAAAKISGLPQGVPEGTRAAAAKQILGKHWLEEFSQIPDAQLQEVLSGMGKRAIEASNKTQHDMRMLELKSAAAEALQRDRLASQERIAAAKLAAKEREMETRARIQSSKDPKTWAEGIQRARNLAALAQREGDQEMYVFYSNEANNLFAMAKGIGETNANFKRDVYEGLGMPIPKTEASVPPVGKGTAEPAMEHNPTTATDKNTAAKTKKVRMVGLDGKSTYEVDPDKVEAYKAQGWKLK